MVAVKRHINREYLDLFQSRLSGLGAESMLRYRRTISELDLFLTGHGLLLADLSPVMMADWAADLLRRGLSKKTVARHLNILSGMMKAAAQKGLAEPTDIPRTLSKKVDADATPLPPLMKEQAFEACLTILRNALRPMGPHDLGADMLLVSLLNGVMPLEKVAMLKKADMAGFSEASRSILERNAEPRRLFVFDLQQSYRTPAQIRAALAEGLGKTFRECLATAPVSSAPDPDALARSLWTACAIRGGATASEAMAYAGGDAPYILPEFCLQAQDSAPEAARAQDADFEARSGQWMKTVGSMLTHESPKWYAMHLRGGVKFDELRKDIFEFVKPVPELFYPCETIRRQIGGKMVMEDHPFISRTAFFRIHPDRVASMFHAIGDKAWCYRLSGSPGAPYAIISQADMRRFQAAVGVYTPDIEIHPLGKLVPKPGESVVVIMAGYQGREAKVEDIINTDCGSVIIRVKLSTDQGYEWRLDVDPRQLDPVPK